MVYRRGFCLKLVLTVCLEICLTKSLYFKVLENNITQLDLEIILKNFNLKFQCELSTKLPNYLCEECFQSLTNALEFEKKVKNSYEELKDSLEQSLKQNYRTQIKEEIKTENEVEIYYEELPENAEEWLQDEKIPDSPKIDKLKTENVFSSLEEIIKLPPTSRSKSRPPRKCLICPELFADIAEYQLHRQTHTQCPVCFKQYLTAKSCFAHHNTAHREIPDKELTCQICGQKFKRKKNVLTHIRAFHNKERNFKCDICDRAFYEKTHLNNHKTTHKDDKPFECDECDLKFRTSVALKGHKKFHHPDENGEIQKLVNKEFICNVCGKVLRGMGTLRIHQMIHTQDFKFECDVCQKKCKTSSILKIHQLIHTGEKPHKCNLCPKEFRLWNSLNMHKLTHKKQVEGVSSVTKEFVYECEICNKKFRVACLLKNHKRVHTGEKPYKCDLCSKQFRTSGQVAIHKLSHGPKVKYTCSICGMVSNYKKCLESHMKKMHSLVDNK